MVGKLPSGRITANSQSSKPTLPCRRPRISKWTQLDAVVPFQPFKKVDAVPAGNAKFRADKHISVYRGTASGNLS
ncbi:hypothetical protein GCM10023264_11150 [Sphingomonas daechungensis]